MAYPTYRQDFDGGSTLGTACPELTDSSTTPPGWSIDTGSNGLTGANSLSAIPGRSAASLIVSSVNDSLSGNITISAYVRSINTGTTREYRLYARATSGALTTGYFVDITTTGLVLFGQAGGTTTFSVPGGLTGVAMWPTGVVVLLQLRISGTSPVTVSACFVRQDTGQFWTNAAGGSWTSTPTYVSGTDSTGGVNTGAGLIGINHWCDNTGANHETFNYTDALNYGPAVPAIDVPTFTLTSATSSQQLTAGGFTDPVFGVTWSSSNAGVATVNSSGLVTSVGVGSATITATGKRDTAQTATAAVTVSSIPVLTFLYRIPVTVDNTANTTSALSYYQVGIALSGAAYTSINAHARADRADLRVFDSDGLTPLSFALETNDTVNSVVYLLVKVPRVAAAGTRTIYVYYGSASAPSISSYPSTIGPSNALVGPVDVWNQANQAGINALAQMVQFKNQDKAHGGGAGLNGQFLIFCESGGTLQEGDNSKLAIVRSTNNGVTWTGGTNILTPTAGKTAAARSIIELADGTLIVCYDYDLNATHVAGKAQEYVGKSVDGGTTWSNVSATPSNPLAVPWTVGTDIGVAYGAMIEKTPGGDLYLPVYALISTDTGFHVWLLKCPSGSDPTNGSNWVVQGVIAFDNVNPYNETTVVQTTDSSHYLAIMRASGAGGVGAAGDLFFCTSSNSGVTWTTPVEMFLPGVTSSQWCAASPFAIRLANGNIALFWGIRYGIGNPPSTIQIGALLSTDGGVTWNDRPPASLYSMTNDTTNPGAIGYPFAVQRPDGKIVVAYHHEVGGNSSNQYNVSSVIVDEDYICNALNTYVNCESLAGLTAGANATLSTTHVHTGTSAIKIDNSAATGGINDYLLINLWSTNPAQQMPKAAYSYWSYETANDVGRVAVVKDATGTFVGGTGQRVNTYVLGATFHQSWYDGSAQHDTGVVVPENQWNKIGVRANVLASSVTGELRLNGVSTTTGLGQSGSGGSPQMVLWQGGSTASTHNVTYWLDDIYTHQYTASIPVVTAGAEQFALNMTAAITLAPDTVAAAAVALPPRTGTTAVTLAPDTVTATAVTFLPKLASAAITLAPDTVTAAALAVVPGAATAVGSFTLRADIVTCIAQPFVQTTSNYLLIDPEQTTRL